MSRTLLERPRAFYPVFTRKDGDPTVTHYCPGCGHGNVHKYVAEAIDDFGIADRVIFINPVGCAVFAYHYLDVGHIQAAHGRAPAVATAVKRARPDSIVICYQGDGDLAAIGGNEILHAANRGESLTVIFINNAIYGMTGGQMAPTTLLGQVTTTTPSGRSAGREGHPLRVCELLSSLAAPASLERVALGDAKHDMAARKAIRRAIRNQIEGKGFSLVEVLSPCPIGWKMPPVDAAKHVVGTMTKTFPPGSFKDFPPQPGGAAPPPPDAANGRRSPVPPEAIPEILGLLPRAAGESVVDAGTWPRPDIEPRFLDPRIIAAGFGGQGVLFLGTLLAEAGSLAGWSVSWLPSYGPEMRGGTAHCHVILSRSPVDSPLVSRASVLFAFNRPSLDRFLPDVTDGGLVIYDSGLISDPPDMSRVEAIGVPATAIAEKAGSARVANLVALGAYLGRTRVLPEAAVARALAGRALPIEAVELNLDALRAGMRWRAPS
jgi:2-oxoisovalerate ferredoxin oxidoreductase beta subunit